MGTENRENYPLRCLYCGKKLALLRKLTDSEFCSSAHRKLYQNEHEKMALARLVDAEDRFLTYAGPGSSSVRQKVDGVNHDARLPDDDMRGFLVHSPEVQTLERIAGVDLAPQLIIPDPSLPALACRFGALPRFAPKTEISFAVGIRAGDPKALVEQQMDFRVFNCPPPAFAATQRSTPWAIPIGARLDWAWIPDPVVGAPVSLTGTPLDRQVDGASNRPLVPVYAARVVREAIPESTGELPAFAGRIPIECTARDIAFRLATGDAQPAGIQTAVLLGSLRNELRTAWNPPQPAVEPIQVEQDVAPVECMVELPDLATRVPIELTVHACAARTASSGVEPDQFRPCTASMESLRRGLRTEWNPSPSVPPEKVFAEWFENQPTLSEQLLLLDLSIRFLKPNLPMRRPRLREVFFPLPGLGGLQTIAFRIAQGADVQTAGPELTAKPWLMPDRFEPRSRNCETVVPPVPAFEAISGHLNACVPYAGLSALTPPFVLGAPGSVECAHAAASMRSSLFGAIVLESVDLPAPRPLAPVRGYRPAIRLAMVESPLTDALRMLSIDICPKGDIAHLEIGTASEQPRHPVEQAENAKQGITSSLAMTGLNVRVLMPRNGAAKGIDLALEPSAKFLTLVSPQSRTGGGSGPSRSDRCMAHGLGTGDPIAPASNEPIRSEPSSFWPEPHRMVPRLRTSVIEDSKVIEAARAAQILITESQKAWKTRFAAAMPSLPSLPSLPAIRVPHRSMHWVLMASFAAVIFAVGTIDWSSEKAEVANVEPAPAPERPVAAEEPPAKKPVLVAQTPAAAPVAVAEPAPAEEPRLDTQPPVASAESGFFALRMANVKRTIMKRARITLSDDFRSGLGEWNGRGDWSKSWSYDSAGFLRTGPLAVYEPSMSMTDYQMRFLGWIEKKSLGWAFRVADLDNYYVSKITITRNGPLPEAIIERYAVIGGKQSNYERRPLPLQVQNDTLYHIEMRVQGENFTLLVQGQVVDHWSDNRIKSGGIGFFSAKGEQARLRWVEVSHQNDFLGQICAFLAPYSLSAKDGSLKQ